MIQRSDAALGIRVIPLAAPEVLIRASAAIDAHSKVVIAASARRGTETIVYLTAQHNRGDTVRVAAADEAATMCTVKADAHTEVNKAGVLDLCSWDDGRIH